MSTPARLAILPGGTQSRPMETYAIPTETSHDCFEVLEGGLETTVQDYWGREGFLSVGVPRSGAADRLSFQLGNQLLNNEQNAAGLEIQFLGPKLRFCARTVIAIAGADNHPKLNQTAVDLWQPILVQPGDILSFGHAKLGARTYITFAGGIDVPLVMGSRSTFLKAQMGGFKGRKLMKGDILSTFTTQIGHSPHHMTPLPPHMIPEFSRHWQVDVLAGPHDDWLTPADMHQLLNYDWVVSSRSDRIGYRLDGPQFIFSDHAHSKSPDNGSHPSNKIDYGCPIGSVLLCGHTPTILLADCPSLTGYMAPFTVVEDSLRKVAQARPQDLITFNLVEMKDLAQVHFSTAHVATMHAGIS